MSARRLSIVRARLLMAGPMASLDTAENHVTHRAQALGLHLDNQSVVVHKAAEFACWYENQEQTVPRKVSLDGDMFQTVSKTGNLSGAVFP